MDNKPSLSDIARIAGVTKTTVSIVLNGKGDKGRICRDTQSRIRAVAKELGYQKQSTMPVPLLDPATGVPPKMVGLLLSGASPASILALIPERAASVSLEGCRLVVVTLPPDPTAARARVLSLIQDRFVSFICCPTVYAVTASVSTVPVTELAGGTPVSSGGISASSGQSPVSSDGKTPVPTPVVTVAEPVIPVVAPVEPVVVTKPVMVEIPITPPVVAPIEPVIPIVTPVEPVVVIEPVVAEVPVTPPVVAVVEPSIPVVTPVEPVVVIEPVAVEMPVTPPVETPVEPVVVAEPVMVEIPITPPVVTPVEPSIPVMAPVEPVVVAEPVMVEMPVTPPAVAVVEPVPEEPTTEPKTPDEPAQ
ncbi:MAG: LacI family DNA-binding transcriptional regulator [bacterium]